jgi:cyclopropane fatty-acyl-phospholipid synthase-like methyltransferase
VVDLDNPRYPRSSTYPAAFQLASCMGPNVLWLTEALCNVMPLEPGMRVLDLGCGRAASSIFLAREFGVQVVAADLWIAPTENWDRIVEFGCESQVMPLHVEAHDLEFARGSFDAIVSLDAYHYFGGDDAYLGELTPFLRPGGRLGIVVPGVRDESDRLPPHVAPFEFEGYDTLHSPDWWREHWERRGLVTVERADWIDDGWVDWLAWNEITLAAGAAAMADAARSEIEMLTIDAGRTLGFSRAIARKNR